MKERRLRSGAEAVLVSFRTGTSGTHSIMRRDGRVLEFRGDQVVIEDENGSEVVVAVPWEVRRIELGMPVVLETVNGQVEVHWEGTKQERQLGSRPSGLG